MSVNRSGCCSAEIQHQINAVIGRCQDSAAAQLKAAADEIIQLLLENNLAHYDTVSIERIAPHPSNRFGSVVNPVDVHKLLALILAAGFSASEMTGALAFEIMPGEQGDNQFQKYEHVQQMSDDSLPQLHRGNIKILTVCCSHTVSCLNCIEQGLRALPELDQKYLTDGRISKEKVIGECPSIRSPLAAGVKFLVIRHQVDAACPQLATFLQEAGNAHKGVERLPSQLQFMIQICERLQRGTPENVIIQQLERQYRPAFVTDSAKHLVAYACMWAGGADNPVFLTELDAFSKSLTQPREVPGVVLTQLAQLKLAAYPEYANAVMKAMLASPENWASKGKSTLFTTEDILQIEGKLRDQAVAAVEWMRKARAYADKLIAAGVLKTSVDLLVSKMQVNMVMCVHKRGKKKHEKVMLDANVTLKACADDFVRDASQLHTQQGCKTDIPQPWDVDSRASSTPSDKLAPPTSRVYTNGRIELSNTGFKYGSVVENSKGEKFIVRFRLASFVQTLF